MVLRALFYLFFALIATMYFAEMNNFARMFFAKIGHLCVAMSGKMC